jgi:hypothetical protein
MKLPKLGFSMAITIQSPSRELKKQNDQTGGPRPLTLFRGLQADNINPAASASSPTAELLKDGRTRCGKIFVDRLTEKSSFPGTIRSIDQ